MSKQSGKNIDEPSDNVTNAKENIKAYDGQETIAYIFGVIGALIFSYVSFFNHNISIWVAFLGVCSTLIGVAIYSQGKISSSKLYSLISIIIVIALIVTFALQTNDPEEFNKNVQPDLKLKDSLIALLNDSIQKSESFIFAAESIKTVSIKTIEKANKYYQIENSPSIQAEYLSIEINPNKKIVCNIILTNYGKTTARNITSSNYFVFHTVNSYNRFTLDNKVILKIQDLNPSQNKKMVNETEKEINQEYYNLISTQKLFLYNYGCIVYQDISNKKYTYFYCTVYDFERQVFYEIPDPVFVK